MIPGLCEVQGCKASKDSLSRCGRCKIALYCGREHQNGDFSEHKSFCKSVAKHYQNIEHAKQELIAEEDGMFVPHDVFRNGVGSFWGIFPSRPYMRAKGALIEICEIEGTPNALVKAAAEIEDCLRLCHGDNMGLRYQYQVYIYALAVIKMPMTLSNIGVMSSWG
jgi:hypothetical protein